MGRAGGANRRCRGGQAVRTGNAGAAESEVAQSAVDDRCGGDAGAGFCQAGCSTGAADAPGAHSLQSAVGDRCGVDAGARRGRTGGRVKDALFWADLHLALPFPQVALFKGANLPKPVHTPRLRPTHTSPTPHTHLAHAPHAPRSRPILRCPTVQKTGRFTSPSPISAGRSPPKPKSADFLYPPHQIAPTGRNAPAI